MTIVGVGDKGGPAPDREAEPLPGLTAETSPFRADALAGRVALVTGGGSGIGFGIARQLGMHGAKGVVIMGRRQGFLDEAVAELAKSGVRAVGVSGDVRSPADCARAVQTAVSTYGGLDTLVNSAAGNFLASAEDLSEKGFRTVMEIDSEFFLLLLVFIIIVRS